MEIVLFQGWFESFYYQILFDDEEGDGRIGFFKYLSEKMNDKGSQYRLFEGNLFKILMKRMAQGKSITSFIEMIEWETL